jgi:hypothetical protein
MLLANMLKFMPGWAKMPGKWNLPPKEEAIKWQKRGFH